MNLDYIKDQYINCDRSAADIARELNLSEKTISVQLRKAGVPTKRRIKQDLKQDLNDKVFGKLTIIQFVIRSRIYKILHINRGVQ